MSGVEFFVYPGFGWELGWKDGKVIVFGVHNNSPAQNAGVSVTSIVLMYEDVPLEFASGDEWLEFFGAVPIPTIGEDRIFKIFDGSEERLITLIASEIVLPSFTNRLSDTQVDGVLVRQR